MTADVRVSVDVGDLSLRAAEAAVATITTAVRTAGTCSLVLSGGSTPRLLHGLLASRYRDRIPWADVHVFWGDERYVPPGDQASNYRMAKETLLDHVPCPAANIHPMPTHFASADAAARDYERTLRSRFAAEWPEFTLVLLGLGEDGHTASLFPGSPASAEHRRWVVAAETPATPAWRLTLTWPVLMRAANLYVLVAGAAKARALGDSLAEAADPDRTPAARLRMAAGHVIWWADRASAGLLPS